MNANEVLNQMNDLNQMNEMLKTHLSENNLKQVNIPFPNKDVEMGLIELGISYECHLDKWFGNNTNYPGLIYLSAFIPQEWLVDHNTDCDSIFADYCDNGDHTPICLLPLETIGLVYNVSDGDYASSSRLCYPSDMPNIPVKTVEEIVNVI